MDLSASLADLKGDVVTEKVVHTSKSWRAGRRLRRLGRGLYCRSPAAAPGERRKWGVWLAKTFCSRRNDVLLENDSEREGEFSFLYVERMKMRMQPRLTRESVALLYHATNGQRINTDYGRCEFIRRTVWINLYRSSFKPFKPMLIHSLVVPSGRTSQSHYSR